MIRHAAGDDVLDLVAGRVDVPVSGAEVAELDRETVPPGLLWMVPSWRRLAPGELGAILEAARSQAAAGIVVQDDDADAVARAVRVLRPDHPSSMTVLRLGQSLSWRRFQALVEHEMGERAAGLPGAVPIAEGLYRLADEVAEKFGGAVAIENHRRELVAYSTVEALIDDYRREGILRRRVPELERNDGQYREVLRAEGVVRFPEFERELPRAATAIRAGGLPLGTIWVIDPGGADPEQPLDAEKERSLLAASRRAADLLVDAWLVHDAGSRLRDDATRRVLLGQLRGDERGVLSLPSPELVLAAFASAAEGDADVGTAPLHEAVRRRVATRWQQAATAALADLVFALLPDGPRDEMLLAIEQTRDEVTRSAGVPVTVALSLPARSLAAIAARRREVAALLRVSGPGEPAACAERRLGRLVDDALLEAASGRPELRHPALDRGGRKAEQLRATMLAYLEQGSRAAPAAAALGVHENSVRYRVQRACEEWGVDLEDPDARFALWSSLRSARGSL